MPANVNSLRRSGDLLLAWLVGIVPKTGPPSNTAMVLALSQNGVEPSFKVFLAFGP